MADVVMPRLSDSMEEGTILQWLKQVGDEIAVGDELVEIETDKANMAYESDVGGTLTEILVQEGDTVPIGVPIARVGGSDEGSSASAAGPGAAAEGPAGGRTASVLGPLPSPPFERLVIACDTDVVLDGRALGKPGDEAEAREYLELLSGRAHEVLSGLVVLADGEERSGLERTVVVFKQLDADVMERYVRFGEWRGRSGGYAIQTLGSTLVARIEGSVSNVVGLPVGLLAELAPELLERS
jgi:MAF protein